MYHSLQPCLCLATGLPLGPWSMDSPPSLVSDLPSDHQTVTVGSVTGAGWPALWAPALTCCFTTNSLGSDLALAAIPRLGCWAHFCPVGWGSPALLTELSSSTPHPVGICQPFLIPDPWEVSMERWFFGKTHLGVKHFLNYQHSTTRACDLGDILSAHWGRWHRASKLCLPSYLQCGKCVITSSLVAKLISIPAMGCDVFLNSAGWPGRSFCPALGKDVWGFGDLFLVCFLSC